MKKDKITIEFSKRSFIITICWMCTIVLAIIVSPQFFHVHNIDYCEKCKKINAQSYQEGWNANIEKSNEYIRKSNFLDEQIVFITPGKMSYHTFDCDNPEMVSPTSIGKEAISLKQAKEDGMTPCLLCHPPE